jgi:hypothetical protein
MFCKASSPVAKASHLAGVNGAGHHHSPEGALSDLSSLGLREVVGPIGDAESHLRASLTVDTPDEAAGELFASSNPLRGSHVQHAQGTDPKAISLRPLAAVEPPSR